MCCGGNAQRLVKVGSKVMRGAVGLGKAAMHIDPAPDELIQQRRDICRACPHAIYDPQPERIILRILNSISRCRLCDCVIKAKTRIAGERCPASKW